MTLPSAEFLLEMREQFSLDVHSDEREWEYVKVDPDRAAIYPSSCPSVLFRGQNARYSPSLTALGRYLAKPPVARIRDLDLIGQARLAERLIRRLWFCNELEEHPGSKWLSSQKLQGFEFALAQHYGIPTGYMDLSESFDVSCFFATCYIDKLGGWQPCTSGAGIMYMVPIERLPIRPDVLQPIGLQILPRPREQFGWVIVCGIGTDFEDIPGLQAFEFEHNESVSRYFLEKFSEGDDLFPADAMATVADRISASKLLPQALSYRVVADLCAQDGGLTASPASLLAALDGELGLQFRDIRAFDTHLLDQAAQEWQARSEQFFRHIGFRLVPSRPVAAEP
jgi:hypothetical protein